MSNEYSNLSDNLDIDLSWVYQEELKLKNSQHIVLQPISHISVTSLYIENDEIISSNKQTLPLSIENNHSILSSDTMIRTIQTCKKGPGTGSGSGHWNWNHGTIFHIDVDIHNIYHFSAIFNKENNYLKPLDPYRNLRLIENPTIYHSYSHIYLFFYKALPIVSILRSHKLEDKVKSTKRVRIDLSSIENKIISTAGNRRKTRKKLT